MSFMGVEDAGHSELDPNANNEKAGRSHPVNKHRAALQLRDLANDKERQVVQSIVADPDLADEAGLAAMAKADYKFHASELPPIAEAQPDQEMPPAVKEILSLPGLHREAVAQAEIERLTQEIEQDFTSLQGIKEEWMRASAGGVERARALGRKIIAVKTLLQKTKGAGHFLKWCDRLPFSVDQAERYMRLARLPEKELEGMKPQSQRQALMLTGFLAMDEKKRLAAPKEADDLTTFRKLMGRLMTQAKRYEEEHGQELLKISKPYNEWLAEQEARLEASEAEMLMTQTRRWEQDHERERLEMFNPVNAGQEDGLEANREAVDVPSGAGQEPGTQMIPHMCGI
jgi:hypothetical protein